MQPTSATPAHTAAAATAAPAALDLTAYMDATAALLGLPLLPEHRPGVLRYLQLVSALAPRVTEFAATLTPVDESGNTFTPVPAPGGAPL